VPFGQEALYAERVAQAGASSQLHQRSVTRYGHCALEQSELLAGFSELTGAAASISLASSRRWGSGSRFRLSKSD
jgi:hypothetical protein